MIAPPMGEWELVFGPREYEPDEGRDVQVGWAYGVERDGLQLVINVEVAQSLAAADKTAVPDFVRAALRTRGRSAIVPLAQPRQAAPARAPHDDADHRDRRLGGFGGLDRLRTICECRPYEHSRGAGAGRHAADA